MKFVLAIFLIVIVAILGARIISVKRRLPMGIHFLLLSGTGYIFLGAALGRMGLNFLDPETLGQFESFILFGLAWIGFLFGLQFEIKQLRNLPRYYFSITVIQAIITFCVVFIPVFLFLKKYGGIDNKTALTASLVLASTACCTAPAALALVANLYKLKNRGLLELLRYISSVDSLVGLFFFTLALCINLGGYNREFSLAVSGKWLLVSTGIGMLCAGILYALSKSRYSQTEFLLFLIGTVLFGAGLTFKINHSPLVTGIVCGFLLANMSHSRMRALTTALHAERSIYVVLLFLLGAGWSFEFNFGIILIILYFCMRVLGKTAGAWTATRVFRPNYKVPATLGLGLVSEGGLAVAMIINYKLLAGARLADLIVTVIIFSVILSEITGPNLILKLFPEREK
ncbi:MAG: hypothetical protein ABIA63_01320 [bacterium]